MAEEDVSPAAFDMPDEVGGYKIVGCIGEGSFGKVWRGEDRLGAPVAIKALHGNDKARAAELKATFALVQRLTSTHIAAPLRLVEMPRDGSALSGMVFTVMRFAPGKPLDAWFDDWLENHPSATFEARLAVAIGVCRQVAEALDEAHRNRIMHLDVKPENIMVEDEEDGGFSVQLLDLGLAHRIEPDRKIDSQNNPLLGIGTADYIAPEIWIARDPPDGRADQYSLSCVLYWLLSGGTPFVGSFDASDRRLEAEWRKLGRTVDWGHLSKDFRQERRARNIAIGRNVVARTPARPCPGLDAKRNRALSRALSINPKDRYRTCVEMVAAVGRGGGGAKVWMPLVAVGILLAMGAVFFSAWQRLEEKRKDYYRDLFERVKASVGFSRIAYLRNKAEAGDAEAAYDLGKHYADGTGVDKNPQEAFHWFSEAANRNYAKAMFRAGDCLARGFGTARNDAAAAEWFRRGTEKDDADAAGAYAECLWEGRGTGKDREKAAKIAASVADKAVTSAQYVAGMALIEGIGPEHNPQKGAAMVEQAAKDHPGAQFAMSCLFSQGLGVPKDEGRAAQWALQAAKNGLLDAMLDVATRYTEGRGFSKSPTESRTWFDRAAKIDSGAVRKTQKELDDADADRKRKEEEANQIKKARAADPLFDLKRNAEDGDPAAMFELAKRLDEGIGTGKDQAAAVRWWKALAEKTDVDAADVQRREEAWGRYGMHLIEGTGVARDVAAAVPWLEKYANATEDNYGTIGLLGSFGSGNAAPEQTPAWVGSERRKRRGGACLAVARAYENGDGIAKSIQKAESWYDKGYLDSDECLARLLRLMVERPRDFTDWELGERSALGAQKGNLDGLYLDGRLKLEGSGGLFRKQGFGNLLKAAKSGHVEAQLEVGCCYADGKGTEKDLGKAYEWYLKAAQAGNAGAQTNVGFCLMYGDGVGQDRFKAVEWFKKAAEHGNAVAQFNLGVLYENGDVVRRDLAEARRWYEKAAAQGIDKARKRLANLGSQTRGRQSQPDVGAMPKAVPNARAVKTDKEADDPDALFAQGYRYITGDGVARDARKAAELFQKAADMGHATAIFNLGVCYEEGAGVPKNMAKAASLYKQAAEKGMPNAQYNYGVFLLDGRGIPKDREAAVKWLRKAAAQGHAGARKILKQLGK